MARRKVIEINMKARIEWNDLRRQRAYITNECMNADMESRKVLLGIESLLDAVADACYDAAPELERKGA